MNKPVLRSILFYTVLSIGFILFDLLIDDLGGGIPGDDLTHVIFAAAIVLASYLMMSRAMEAHKRAESLLRQTRDEMESRVRARTIELEGANQALQTEIAERQRIERALRESEERYRTLFDSFPEPTTVWDKNGVLLMQNLVSARNLGGRRDDYVGRTIHDIFGEAAVAYKVRMVRVIDTGTVECQEDVVELPLGARYFWTCMQRIQHPDGQSVVHIISYDITDRKRTEEALRASEEKFATVFHFSPDAIGMFRIADGVLLDANEAVTRILGYSQSDLVGRGTSQLRHLLSIEDHHKVMDLFLRNQHVADYELDCATKDGGVATLLVSLMAIVIGGEPRMLAIAHDITNRKQSEEALRGVQAELAQSLQERTALEVRQRLARELHDSVSQVFYGISLGAHTALTLLDTDRGKVVEALNYVLALTKTGIIEMHALIFELRPESLEMEGLAVALTRQTAAIRARHGIDVELSLCAEPDVPLPIKEALYRIAQEAMQNAIKHARPNRLDVRLTCESDSLRLEVRDDGVGFDPQAVYPGHLGLRSMRERASRAGGTLEIISTQDRGAQIRARIPIPVIQAV